MRDVAGVSAQPEVWEGMHHVFQLDVAHIESSRLPFNVWYIEHLSRYVRSCKGQVGLQGYDARLSCIRSSRIEESMKTSSVFVQATLAAIVSLASHAAIAADNSGTNTAPTHDSSLSVTAGGVSHDSSVHNRDYSTFNRDFRIHNRDYRMHNRDFRTLNRDYRLNNRDFRANNRDFGQ